MAKLQEEIIVIKLSRLLRDSEPESEGILNDETRSALEGVVGELAGAGVLVELAVE